MKIEYTNANIEIINLVNADIVTASGDNDFGFGGLFGNGTNSTNEDGDWGN